MALIVVVDDEARDVWHMAGTHSCGHPAPRGEFRGFGMDFNAEGRQQSLDRQPKVCYHCYSYKGQVGDVSGACDEVCRMNGTHPFDPR